MLRRREHHVLEPAEHVRADRLALVAAGERRDEHFGAGRDAEVVRPERDEPLDERPLGRDALGERQAAFGGGNLDQPPARVLPRLLAGRFVRRLGDRSERPNGFGQGFGRGLGRRARALERRRRAAI